MTTLFILPFANSLYPPINIEILLSSPPTINVGHLSEIPQIKEIKASDVNRLQWILTKSFITEQCVISGSGRYVWTL